VSAIRAFKLLPPQALSGRAGGFIEAREGAGSLGGRQVQDLVADGHARTEGFFTATAAKHAVRQVLDRETLLSALASRPSYAARCHGFRSFSG
jgi:hypothetical protein